MHQFVTRQQMKLLQDYPILKEIYGRIHMISFTQNQIMSNVNFKFFSVNA